MHRNKTYQKKNCCLFLINWWSNKRHINIKIIIIQNALPNTPYNPKVKSCYGKPYQCNHCCKQNTGWNNLIGTLETTLKKSHFIVDFVTVLSQHCIINLNMKSNKLINYIYMYIYTHLHKDPNILCFGR